MSNEGLREGLTVVITGTSSGIGKGTAKQLAKEGANVVLAARRTEEIEKLAEECGPNAIAVTADITKEQDIARLLKTALASYGKIDVWINNSGTGTYGPFTATPLKDLNRTVEVNFLGTLYGSHYALSQFKKQKHGTLINVASFASKVPLAYGAAYTASKYGVAGLTNGLYQEMNMEDYKDIHICSVDPWVTDTPWTVHAGNYSGHEIVIGPADDPQLVVDAIISQIDQPQKILEVGAKAKGAAASSNLLPKTTRTLNSRQFKEMLETAPPSPTTSGSLFEPRSEGTGISGDLRERFEKKMAGEK